MPSTKPRRSLTSACPQDEVSHAQNRRNTSILAAATAAVAALLPVSASATTASAGHALPLPPLKVLTDKPGTGGGDLFVAPSSANPAYASGVEILSPDGRKVVWSHAVPAGQEAADFRKQTFQGRPVLTWWQGTGLGGLTQGVDYIYDDRHQTVAEVRAGNGYSADGHEFLITARGTALILAYKETTADLRSIGGPADQKVIDGVVQEIDIHTGKVVFQWDAADHVPYAQSEQPRPASAATPWDWFHVKAVKVDSDGSLLVDARNTWTTYDVSRTTGAIRWRLGGKDSSFKLTAAHGQNLNTAQTLFAWQHDPEPLGNGLCTYFDNESAGIANTGSGTLSELPYSRVDTVKLDLRTHTATLVRSVEQRGGAQRLVPGQLADAAQR